ncbi:hypothetical protein RHECNPAF_122100113 [Rhizobium etli CNPAF512]|nr:hypothetical protein RHECNPAF_122100113 [Rhizobium etli CNPAF512]
MNARGWVISTKEGDLIHPAELVSFRNRAKGLNKYTSA